MPTSIFRMNEGKISFVEFARDQACAGNGHSRFDAFDYLSIVFSVRNINYRFIFIVFQIRLYLLFFFACRFICKYFGGSFPVW